MIGELEPIRQTAKPLSWRFGSALRGLAERFERWCTDRGPARRERDEAIVSLLEPVPVDKARAR